MWYLSFLCEDILYARLLPPCALCYSHDLTTSFLQVPRVVNITFNENILLSPDACSDLEVSVVCISLCSCM